MKRLFEKKCPQCGAKIPFRLFVGLKSASFPCPQCGARLRSGHIWLQILGMALGSVFIALPIVQARQNALWWWALIPGMGIYIIWSYVFVVPRRE
jgi:prepilin signal peptidase PulO-like enzyme (type II secretory pathway)